MLGTSGTVTTIAGVHLNLKRYDRNRVDGCWMNAQQIDGVIERLLAMSYEDRVASPCIGAERADLVLAGCAILDAIRRAFPCPRLRVADRGLREGMLVQMMRDDGAWGGAGAGGFVVTARGKRGSPRALKVRVKSGKSRSLSSKLWLQRQLNDPYVARAKREGYRSRSAFKLSEIDDKAHVLEERRARDRSRRRTRRLEPGGGQASGRRKGRVVAIDVLAMEPIAGVDFVQLDFLDPAAPQTLKAMLGGPADLVLSDMAANATGHARTDHLKIMALVEAAADFAREVLKPGGAFLAKVLQGGTEATLLAASSATTQT